MQKLKVEKAKSVTVFGEASGLIFLLNNADEAQHLRSIIKNI